MKKISSFFLLPVIIMICAGSGMKTESGSSENSISDSLIKEDIFPLQTQHCHGSTIVELPNGDLLAAWFQGSGERTADDVAIKGSRYNNKTRKWELPFIMADVRDFPDINPVLFIDNKSQLWLVWYTVLAYQWESSILNYRTSSNYMQKSGPPVWGWQDMIHMKPDGSAPDGIGKNDKFVKTLERKYDEYFQQLKISGIIKNEGSASSFNIAKNRYLDIAMGKNLVSTGYEQNDSGVKIKTRLGFPLMRRIGWQTRNKPLITGNRILLPLYSDGFDFSLIAITEDQGTSWQFSEPIVGGGNVQPSLALCKDGSITAFMRDNGPPPQRLMKSSSKDKGLSWSTVVDSDIPNPGTAADVVVLKSGNWVLVHNDIEEGRHRLSVWLSEDEGKSWPHRKILVNGIPGSETRGHYPAVIQGKDGTIHISYTNQVPGTGNQGALKNIVHARLSEKWLLN
jgi:predicted neuraminidase